MTDLIATLEGLTQPSREVDAKIKLAIAAVMISDGATAQDVVRAVGGSLYDDPPPYTASLDAAIALVERVLPGWAKGFDGGPKTCIAFVDPHDHTDRMFGARYTARGPTPAIALLIALLKAKEAKDDAR